MTVSPSPDPNAHDALTPPVSTAGGGPRGMRSRGLLFALFALLCVAATAAYVVKAVRRDREAKQAVASGPVAADQAAAAFVPPTGPTLLFTNLTTGTNQQNRAAVVSLQSPEGARGMTRLACQRLYFAGGRGLCLGEGRWHGGARR